MPQQARPMFRELTPSSAALKIRQNAVLATRVWRVFVSICIPTICVLAAGLQLPNQMLQLAAFVLLPILFGVALVAVMPGDVPSHALPVVLFTLTLCLLVDGHYFAEEWAHSEAPRAVLFLRLLCPLYASGMNLFVCLHAWYSNGMGIWKVGRPAYLSAACCRIFSNIGLLMLGVRGQNFAPGAMSIEMSCVTNGIMVLIMAMATPAFRQAIASSSGAATVALRLAELTQGEASIALAGLQSRAAPSQRGDGICEVPESLKSSRSTNASGGRKAKSNRSSVSTYGTDSEIVGILHADSPTSVAQTLATPAIPDSCMPSVNRQARSPVTPGRTHLRSRDALRRRAAQLGIGVIVKT